MRLRACILPFKLLGQTVTLGEVTTVVLLLGQCDRGKLSLQVVFLIDLTTLLHLLDQTAWFND